MRTLEQIRQRIGDRLAEAARNVKRADELTAKSKQMASDAVAEMARAQAAEKVTRAVNVTLAEEVTRLRALVTPPGSTVAPKSIRTPYRNEYPPDIHVSHYPLQPYPAGAMRWDCGSCGAFTAKTLAAECGVP